MTAKPSCWPPKPGEVWTCPSGQWRCLESGLLVQLGDDNPGSGRSPDEVWDEVGPLIPPSRLGAALRQAAHEVQCRRPAVVRADTFDRLSADAAGLLDRAEQVQP